MTSWIALATVATFPSFSPAMEMRPSRVRKIACSDVSLDQFAEIFAEIDRARELRRRDRAAHLGRSRLSHISALMPVKANMPIWSVTWRQSCSDLHHH